LVNSLKTPGILVLENFATGVCLAFLVHEEGLPLRSEFMSFKLSAAVLSLNWYERASEARESILLCGLNLKTFQENVLPLFKIWNCI